MNRLETEARVESLVPAAPTRAMLEGSVEFGRFSAGASDDSSSHGVFAPLHYEPNYAYPLLVWLHGPADDERQLRRVMPHISLRNYVAVAPRGTLSGTGTRGYYWDQDASHIVAAERQVLSAIHDAQRRFNIAPNRIFLAGLQCGGTMAMRLALRHPPSLSGIFSIAGALSIGGAFPVGQAPLGRLRELRGLPLFLGAMRDSVLYPQTRASEDLRLIHSAGMSVHLRQYPCGDELTTEMLGDVDRWIMDQILSC